MNDHDGLGVGLLNKSLLRITIAWCSNSYPKLIRNATTQLSPTILSHFRSFWSIFAAVPKTHTKCPLFGGQKLPMAFNTLSENYRVPENGALNTPWYYNSDAHVLRCIRNYHEQACYTMIDSLRMKQPKVKRNNSNIPHQTSIINIFCQIVCFS